MELALKKISDVEGLPSSQTTYTLFPDAAIFGSADTTPAVLLRLISELNDVVAKTKSNSIGDAIMMPTESKSVVACFTILFSLFEIITRPHALQSCSVYGKIP